MGVIKNIINKEIGRKDFHVRAIKRSYRIRGKVPRAQINRIEKRAVEIIMIIVDINKGLNLVKKKVLVNSLIARMLAYSAIKINANPPALYSTLNPETSSDSPSAKSKGVRFVSARTEVNQMIRINGQSKMGQVICVCFIIVISNVRVRRGIGSIIKIMLTSYEIVWATPRNAPKRAYFELDAHPAPRVVYTFKLETAIKNRMPRGIKKAAYGWGYKDHSRRARIKVMIGDRMYGEVFDSVGFVCSFRNNFSASAKGCGIPIIPTLLGPLRSCA